jgi:predicted nucleic acid-binding protein
VSPTELEQESLRTDNGEFGWTRGQIPVVVDIALNVQDEQANLRALMHRYRNKPMSLADACLVRLAELHTGGEVLTLDSDFRIYRRHGNKFIPVAMPD